MKFNEQICNSGNYTENETDLYSLHMFWIYLYIVFVFLYTVAAVFFEFFLIWTNGLMIEGDVCSTNGKALFLFWAT